ncbi:hypothetical protein [Flavihumibacter fluvii]|uniref:hypothetical protein n=1 Tax=Flavihumibacter fluvii TaxID=2838157 RepID=UPI001BDDD3AF|nr:hypothetical protein [Flavihumibacter fluvii]ULQ51571.1 hypothetical protein KJS93_15890 [Flavihumibacter fluvii]
MKKAFLVLFTAAGLATITMPSCGGGSGKDPEPPAEENLVISAIPALNGQQESPAPGPNFPLSVNVTSKMPPQGVKIEITVKEDGSSTNFFTDTKTTSSSTTSFVITNTPQTVICRVTVTVTSVSKATNNATGFYLYSRK